MTAFRVHVAKPVAAPRSTSMSESSILERCFQVSISAVALSLCGIVLTRGEGWIARSCDVGFWIGVLMLIAVRYIDMRRCCGVDSPHRAKAVSDWRRYSGLLLAVAGCVWAGSRVIGVAM